METPFIGQITTYCFNWAPTNWAMCNGAVMQTAQNQALFALIGTIYGGTNTAFNLPDLRTRTPIGRGLSGSTTYYTQGAGGGTDTFTVPTTALPLHTHSVGAMKATPTQLSPAAGMLAQMPTNGTPPITGLYTTGSTSQAAMAATTIGTTGAATPADNRQLSIALNFCIATQGLWPSRP